MRVLILFFLTFLTQIAMSQQIESIVGVAHADAGPTVRADGDAGDAAEIITKWLGSYLAIECNKKLKPGLNQKLAAAVKKIKDSIPPGATVGFLVLTNKFKCEVTGVVPKTQMVRIQNGKCNIKDLELKEPSVIYDPAVTGFFTINVKL